MYLSVSGVGGGKAKKSLRRRLSAVIFAAVSIPLFILTGCTTSIRLAVERPPALNTAGIKRVAVMPFEYSGNSNREIAEYATTAAINNIRATNHFTLVDHSEIQRLRMRNRGIEHLADATFVGRVTRTAASREAEQKSYTNKDGETVNYTNYITNVEIDFSYHLIRTRDGTLIGPVSRNGRASASSTEAYPAAAKLLRSAADSELRSVGPNLAPYTVYESRTFAADKPQSPELKAEMKNALALVKAGSYKTALEAYLKIYEQRKSAAAAQNASILYESFGDAHAALNLMERAWDETGNPKTRETLARLNRIIRDKEIIAAEYSGNLNQTDKVALFASGEIQKALNPEAKVWVYNNSPNNDIAEAVIDDITSNLIKKGINLVDRDKQRAKLIRKEQTLQRSGSVSDDDIVKIGNAAGANTIVFIGVTGTKATRRLQVRVLDVERRAPVMQSDSSEKWRL